jgi:hypothetical protein
VLHPKGNAYAELIGPFGSGVRHDAIEARVAEAVGLIQSTHGEPTDAVPAVATIHDSSLNERIDVFRPAGHAATRPVMRNMDRARGFPGPNLIDAFSSCFLSQDLFSFLPVIAQVLASVEYCVLCSHDSPSLDYD